MTYPSLPHSRARARIYAIRQVNSEQTLGSAARCGALRYHWHVVTVVGVAQLVEHPVVVRNVAGSSPVAHPTTLEGAFHLYVVKFCFQNATTL